MIESGAGSLVAISSMTGKRPLHGRTPYAAAKMGVIGLVRTLAVELGPHGIRVNAVCPGCCRRAPDRRRDPPARPPRVASPRTRPSWRSPERPRWRRLVTANEVAAACAYLASDAAASITGEDLNVSAGVVMY